MRALLQRVSTGSVSVASEEVGRIAQGLVILIGVAHDDSEADADRLADKITQLRIFNNNQGKFDRSLLDTGGDALVVSQFTLFADTRRGRRPSFTNAAPPQHAEPLVTYFADRLIALGVRHVATGRFGATMSVRIDNEGPVSIWLDTKDPDSFTPA